MAVMGSSKATTGVTCDGKAMVAGRKAIVAGGLRRWQNGDRRREGREKGVPD